MLRKTAIRALCCSALSRPSPRMASSTPGDGVPAGSPPRHGAAARRGQQSLGRHVERVGDQPDDPHRGLVQPALDLAQVRVGQLVRSASWRSDMLASLRLLRMKAPSVSSWAVPGSVIAAPARRRLAEPGHRPPGARLVVAEVHGGHSLAGPCFLARGLRGVGVAALGPVVAEPVAAGSGSGSGPGWRPWLRRLAWLPAWRPLPWRRLAWPARFAAPAPLGRDRLSGGRCRTGSAEAGLAVVGSAAVGSATLMLASAAGDSPGITAVSHGALAAGRPQPSAGSTARRAGWPARPGRRGPRPGPAAGLRPGRSGRPACAARPACAQRSPARWRAERRRSGPLLRRAA